MIRENNHSLRYASLHTLGHHCYRPFSCFACNYDCECLHMSEQIRDVAVVKPEWRDSEFIKLNLITEKQERFYDTEPLLHPFSLQELTKLTINKSVISHMRSLWEYHELIWYDGYRYSITQTTHLRWHLKEWLIIRNKIEVANVPRKLANEVVPKLPMRGFNPVRMDWFENLSPEQKYAVTYPIITINYASPQEDEEDSDEDFE